MSYEKRISEDGVKEYYEDGELIAFINSKGNLQSAHGKSKHREDLEQWIDETGDGSDEDATVYVEPTPKDSPKETPKVEEPKTLPLGEEPAHCPFQGNKSPAVIAWHFKKDRKAAEAKYARFRHLWPE